jgi:thioredoxin reductase
VIRRSFAVVLEGDILDIAVIGAGPYGLSIGAHLNHYNADFRVFGKPMETWRSHVPIGMLLKSDGFASNLSAPASECSLGAYCARYAITYDDFAIPVPLEMFVDYAYDFQQRFLPIVDERTVIGLAACDKGFELRLDDDETVRARQVVLAVGITHFAYMPYELRAIPIELASHSSVHHNLQRFRNRDVTVIGAGASAIDLSALLHEAGANVRLVVRSSAIRFGSVPESGRKSRWQKIRHPQSGLGPGLRSRLACDLPDFFRYLPGRLRLKIVREHLGPASAWYLRPRVIGRVSIVLGHRVTDAEIHGNQVELGIQSMDANRVSVKTDHVIAATGYRADVKRLHFIDEHLRSRIRTIGQMPVLSRHFESSVPGLYFVGNAAAGSFGPLMRFVYGCDLAARRISGYAVKR